MTRSDRYPEAVRAFETWRLEQKARPPDLFSAPAAPSVDAWKTEVLSAIQTVAYARAELTVEDVPFTPAIDNRSRGWAMQEAARRGSIKPLGWVSGGAGRHGRPVRLWTRVFTTPRAPVTAC